MDICHITPTNETYNKYALKRILLHLSGGLPIRIKKKVYFKIEAFHINLSLGKKLSLLATEA